MTMMIFFLTCLTADDGIQRSTSFNRWRIAWKLAKLKWTNLGIRKESTKKRVCDMAFVYRAVGLGMDWRWSLSIPMSSKKHPPKICAAMKPKWTRVTKVNQKVCGWHQRKSKMPLMEFLWWNGVAPVARKNQKSGERHQNKSLLAITTPLNSNKSHFSHSLSFKSWPLNCIKLMSWHMPDVCLYRYHFNMMD